MVIIHCGCHLLAQGVDFPGAEPEMEKQLSFPVEEGVKRGKREGRAGQHV